MKVNNIVQTSIACPSQWEGTIEGGQMFYCRYRWGILRIHLSKNPTTNVYDTLNDGNCILEKEIGDQWDGVMDTEELIKYMEECEFTFPDEVVF